MTYERPYKEGRIMAKSDTEILNEIEDFLVNNFGEDDEVSGTEAVEMMIHITNLVEQRNKGE